MSPNEIVQMIYKNSKTIKEAIETINDLIADIDNDSKKFTYDLSEEIEDFSLCRTKCPLCGCDIIQIGKDTQSSEYFGQPVDEEIIKWGCNECTYIVS